MTRGAIRNVLGAAASGDPGGLRAETGPVRGDPDRVDLAELDHHGGCGLVGVAEQFAPLGLDVLAVRGADGGLRPVISAARIWASAHGSRV